MPATIFSHPGAESMPDTSKKPYAHPRHLIPYPSIETDHDIVNKDDNSLPTHRPQVKAIHRPFTCTELLADSITICGKKYTRRHNLKRHKLKRHQVEEPGCGNTYNRGKILNVDIQVNHIGLLCDYPHCGKTFSKPEILYDNVKNHAFCDECSEPQENKRELKRHIEIVDQNTPYPFICDKYTPEFNVRKAKHPKMLKHLVPPHRPRKQARQSQSIHRIQAILQQKRDRSLRLSASSSKLTKETKQDSGTSTVQDNTESRVPMRKFRGISFQNHFEKGRGSQKENKAILKQPQRRSSIVAASSSGISVAKGEAGPSSSRTKAKDHDDGIDGEKDAKEKGKRKSGSPLGFGWPKHRK
ncbi:hypothetical protein QBC38DRAFT_461123 [Podospora fimiseda]|uniref:C2H2-type domain-containing protein n=1 Tax=Podospora fimiseda TaxID=252190 RepID=A0AAN6YS14_9PEZI|nr:hypothetical protein QBC38DRAFT_461123 [Podospora fimiseda]